MASRSDHVRTQRRLADYRRGRHDRSNQRRSRRVYSIVLASFFFAFDANCQQSGARPAAIEIPAKIRKSIASTTLRVARGGRTEARELIDLLRALGEPTDAATKLSQKVEAALKKAAKPRERLPADAKALRSAASKLGEIIPTLDPDSATSLADLVLKIDPSVDAAQVAVGRTQQNGIWKTSAGRQRDERAAQIQVALQSARKIPVGVKVSKCQSAFALALLGPDAKTARGHRTTVHSTLAPEKLKRALREAVRATAVSQFLLQDKLVVPRSISSEFIVLTSQPEYERAIDIALEKRLLTETQAADAKQLSGWHLKTGTMLSLNLVESSLQALLFHRLLNTAQWTGPGGYMIRRLPPSLRAGLENWVCLAFFGTHRRGSAWYDAGELGGRSVALTERDKEQREAQLRMARAGMPGARSWLNWLVRHGDDPLWAHTMLEHDGEISGDLLLKTTFVWEYLQLAGPRLGLLIQCELPMIGKVSPGKQHAIVEKALGLPLDELERQWEQWFAPDVAGIAGRLDPSKEESSLTRAEEDALNTLEEVRGPALDHLKRATPPIVFDHDLSIGCREHARYLALNPDQAASWPEAHEEWPDRDGFSTKGAWAASHAVIAPGARTSTAAVMGWINTFYHRLPLLDPGLIRMGFALEDDVAVLDASSLAGPFEGSWAVTWPHDGMKDVPPSFTPELPNPVPDEDQASFGYCVTVQCSPDDWGAIDAVGELRLFEGKPDGAEVDAWISTPTEPSNPDLAPAGTWALIPKERLRSRTQYYAVFTRSNGPTIRFTFKTGT